VQADPGQRVNQAPVGGDAAAGLLVGDREDRSGALVACQDDRPGLARVIRGDRVIAGRQCVVALSSSSTRRGSRSRPG